MPKMKHHLRKLHIGGATTTTPTTAIHHVPPSPPPILAPSFNCRGSNSKSSTTTTASTVNNSENGVVSDFGLLEEEEFLMQLALAISASDPDVHKDPESAQIDAAKQIRLGYEASLSNTQGLVQFQSLRYWNYNVIGYEEKVVDGFYDVYGITSNLTEWGRCRCWWICK